MKRGEIRISSVSKGLLTPASPYATNKTEKVFSDVENTERTAVHPPPLRAAGNPRLNAWLLFFASDDPEDIIRLIEAHQDFEVMYRQIYQICENVENVMGLFSEELAILDRNTVKFMMDEMQEEIDQQKAEIERQKAEIERLREALAAATKTQL